MFLISKYDFIKQGFRMILLVVALVFVTADDLKSQIRDDFYETYKKLKKEKRIERIKKNRIFLKDFARIMEDKGMIWDYKKYVLYGIQKLISISTASFLEYLDLNAIEFNDESKNLTIVNYYIHKEEFTYLSDSITFDLTNIDLNNLQIPLVQTGEQNSYDFKTMAREMKIPVVEGSNTPFYEAFEFPKYSSSILITSNKKSMKYSSSDMKKSSELYYRLKDRADIQLIRKNGFVNVFEEEIEKGSTSKNRFYEVTRFKEQEFDDIMQSVNKPVSKNKKQAGIDYYIADAREFLNAINGGYSKNDFFSKGKLIPAYDSAENLLYHPNGNIYELNKFRNGKNATTIGYSLYCKKINALALSNFFKKFHSNPTKGFAFADVVFPSKSKIYTNRYRKEYLVNSIENIDNSLIELHEAKALGFQDYKITTGKFHYKDIYNFYFVVHANDNLNDFYTRYSELYTWDNVPSVIYPIHKGKSQGQNFVDYYNSRFFKELELSFKAVKLEDYYEFLLEDLPDNFLKVENENESRLVIQNYDADEKTKKFTQKSDYIVIDTSSLEGFVPVVFDKLGILYSDPKRFAEVLYTFSKNEGETLQEAYDKKTLEIKEQLRIEREKKEAKIEFERQKKERIKKMEELKLIAPKIIKAFHSVYGKNIDNSSLNEKKYSKKYLDENESILLDVILGEIINDKNFFINNSEYLYNFSPLLDFISSYNEFDKILLSMYNFTNEPKAIHFYNIILDKYNTYEDFKIHNLSIKFTPYISELESPYYKNILHRYPEIIFDDDASIEFKYIKSNKRLFKGYENSIEMIDLTKEKELSAVFKGYKTIYFNHDYMENVMILLAKSYILEAIKNGFYSHNIQFGYGLYDELVYGEKHLSREKTLVNIFSTRLAAKLLQYIYKYHPEHFFTKNLLVHKGVLDEWKLPLLEKYFDTYSDKVFLNLSVFMPACKDFIIDFLNINPQIAIDKYKYYRKFPWGKAVYDKALE